MGNSLRMWNAECKLRMGNSLRVGNSLRNMKSLRMWNSFKMRTFIRDVINVTSEFGTQIGELT